MRRRSCPEELIQVFGARHACQALVMASLGLEIAAGAREAGELQYAH